MPLNEDTLAAGLFEGGDEIPLRGKRRKVNKIPPVSRQAVLGETISPLKGALTKKVIGTVDLETFQWKKPYAVGFFALGEFRCFESEIKNGERVLAGPNRWKCIDDFLDYFLQPKFLGVEIFAHNGGRFDFQFLVRRLMEPKYLDQGFEIRAIPIQSCMFRIEITHPSVKGKWLLLDSMRLMPMSLEKAGKKLGLGGKQSVLRELGCKKEDKFVELARAKNAKIMRKYNERDCRLLYDVVSQYQSFVNHLGAEMKNTTPATSLDLHRRKYLSDKIFTNRHFADCPDLNRKPPKEPCLGCGHAFSRRALAGGRTEIFTMKFSAKRGSRANQKRRLIYEDFNSMYPAMMRAAMPGGMAVVVPGGTEEQIAYTSRKGAIGVIECEVEIPKDCYLPPLPVKYSTRLGITEPDEGIEAKLIFPVGRFSGVWTTAELALLPLCGGRITKVIKQAWYAGQYLFREFVDDLYQYRDKGRSGYDPARSELAKLFMNSLFGKFSQREERVEFIFNPPPERVEHLDEWVPDSDIFVNQTWLASDHIAPQISAYITSLARATLWRRMKEIVDAGGTLYYCDTDSVVYEPAQGKVPTDSKELGKTKIEHVLQRAEFKKPKYYLLDCAPECPCKPLEKKERSEDDESEEPWVAVKVRAKGYGAGLTEARFNQHDFERTLAGIDPNGKYDVKGFTREVMVSFREGLAGFAEARAKNLPEDDIKHDWPRTKMVTKVERSKYDKRTICADGNATVPLILNTISS